MKPLELDKRPCHLGPSLNNRREKHGTENVPALDFSLTGYLLTKPELDKLVGQGFWNSRYETRSGGQPPAPAWKKMRGEKFGEKLEADVTLSFLSDSEKPVVITEAKVGKLDFDYQVGGLTACDLTISTAQDDVDVNKLRRHMDGEISVEITLREPKPEKGAKKAAPDNEPELGLVHPGGESPSEGEEGEDADADEKIGVGAEHLGPETRAAVKKAAKQAPAKKSKAKAKR
jgi:hypothetical protein